MYKFKTIYKICLFLLIGWTLNGQQLPYSSQFSETKDLWNPANTAVANSMYIDAFFRQQWLGFGNGAPTTGYGSLQMPFVDYNMSAGGNIIFDKTGPVSKFGLNLNYAYKLKEVLGDDSQLSFGVNGGFSNYSINTSSLIVNNIEDPLVAGNSQSKFFPSLGAGLYFISNTDEKRATHSFNLGLAFLQAYESNLLVASADQKRTRHVVFNMGTKFYGDDGYFEPAFLINFVNPEIMELQVAARYEMNDRFWGGLGYSNVNELGIQGGFILNEFGNRYSKLRIGALSNIAITDRIKQFGPSFEILVRYEFDME